MEGGPESSVLFSITEQQNFFRRHFGNSEWVVQIDELPEPLPIDEGREKARPFRSIKIRQHSQLAVVAKLLAQEGLIVMKHVARFDNLWPTAPHSYGRRVLCFIKSLVCKSHHQG